MDKELPDRLIARTQSGDAGAFPELVDATRGLAYGIAYRITGNREDALDVIQEAYLRVWRHLGSFNGKPPFLAWFHPVVRNLSVDCLRKAARRSGPMRPGPDLVSAENPDIQLERKELSILIRSWIPKLPAVQRTVFIMRDLEDLSIREVMEQAGLSESSVKSNLSVARKKLAVFLTKSGYNKI